MKKGERERKKNKVWVDHYKINTPL